MDVKHEWKKYVQNSGFWSGFSPDPHRPFGDFENPLGQHAVPSGLRSGLRSALRASLRPPLRPSGPADWPRPNTPCLPVKHAKLQLITSNLPLITPKNQIIWHLPKKWAVDFTINVIYQVSLKYSIILKQTCTVKVYKTTHYIKMENKILFLMQHLYRWLDNIKRQPSSLISLCVKIKFWWVFKVS